LPWRSPTRCKAQQLEATRVRRDDVQNLLRRVTVVAAADLTAAYPGRTSTRVRIATLGGGSVEREQSDF
jgi:2-methylcitrate dehydratase